MKFKVDANELKRGVSFLSPIVDVNSPNVGMRHILIEKRDDSTVELKGFNEYANASYMLKVRDLEGSNKGYVLSKTFFSLVKSFSGTVSVSVSKRLYMEVGSSKYSIATLDSDSFDASSVAQIDYYSISPIGKVKLAGLKTRLTSLFHCLSDDDSRPELQHVYFKALDEQSVVACACDGSMGSIVECDQEYSGLSDLFIHKDLVNSIMNIDNSNDIGYLFEDGKIYFMTHNFIIASSITDIEYPFETFYGIYKESLGDNKPLNICLDPDSAKEALNRLLYLTDPSNNSIEVLFENNSVTFAVEENNSGRETITLLSDENLENGYSLFVDGKKLKDALSKTFGQVYWKSENPQEVQFICDGQSTQFFFGLED